MYLLPSGFNLYYFARTRAEVSVLKLFDIFLCNKHTSLLEIRSPDDRSSKMAGMNINEVPYFRRLAPNGKLSFVVEES